MVNSHLLFCKKKGNHRSDCLNLFNWLKDYFFLGNLIAACAAARRATGTRNGEHET